MSLKIKPRRFLLALGILFLGWGGGACVPTQSTNFAVDTIAFVQMDGTEVKLSDLPGYRIALNLYSPTCVPCVKELPTLQYISLRLSVDKRFQLFLVAEPKNIQETSGLDPKPGLEGILVTKAILEKEIQDRKITIPFLIAKEPFRISPNGLVTGTPETLLFQNKPLQYYYNFIGSISEKTTIPEIEKDKKVQFFLRMMGLGEI